jgi:hypothetical protein
MSNPLAFFDLLHIGERMTDLVEGFSTSEIHLFSYASCLLSLYDGQPVADWGYDFVSTENGLPFSKDLDAATATAESLGFIERKHTLFIPTEDGISELAELRIFETNQCRTKYLEGAVDALLVLNPGNIREAFDFDPAIKFLKKGKRTDWVLTEPVIARLYENFDQLRKTLALEVGDFSVPFVTWLRYLINTGRNASYGNSTSQS